MKYFKESQLCIRNKDNSITCLACQRKCNIPDRQKGFCKVRINIDGKLYAPYGYFSSINIDPIEKKPLYHFMPGSYTLSFGMFGCNFRCLYCQNYEISQADDSFDFYLKGMREYSVNDFYEIMKKNNINIAVSTYNEPVVSIEWAYDIFSYIKNKNTDIKTGFVSNGYLSQESLNFIKPVIDFIKIDLKVFEANKFKKLTYADFDKFIESVRYISKSSLHIEFVNLVVEGFNDDIKDFDNMIEFILSISPDIPVHLTAFHPDYRMTDRKKTSPCVIENLISRALEKGLRYVYGGNYLTARKDTLCYACQNLIVRRGYMSCEFKDINVRDGKGFCPECGSEIYGVWV